MESRVTFSYATNTRLFQALFMTIIFEACSEEIISFYAKIFFAIKLSHTQLPKLKQKLDFGDIAYKKANLNEINEFCCSASFFSLLFEQRRLDVRSLVPMDPWNSPRFFTYHHKTQIWTRALGQSWIVSPDQKIEYPSTKAATETKDHN